MEQQEIKIPINDSYIKGDLKLLPTAKGLIIFAHGSGSSRKSTRNQHVATMFNKGNFSTLLFDLLTQQEEIIDQRTLEYRFNMPLLAKRLITVTQWIKQYEQTKQFKLGYFGASTGATATLIAAAQLPNEISAIVSRGGRPDLAHDYLEHIKAPTLLIVGQLDYDIITLNEKAYQFLTCKKELILIPDASHLFEEPGTLEQAAHVALDWFMQFLI